MKTDILIAIANERTRQNKKYGGPEHDDRHTVREWMDFIHDHADRAPENDITGMVYRRQLVRVAALAVAALEASDRAIMQSGMKDDELRRSLRL